MSVVAGDAGFTFTAEACHVRGRDANGVSPPTLPAARTAQDQLRMHHSVFMPGIPPFTTLQCRL